MIAAVNNPDYEIEALEEIILRDLSVSYKLLAQINSAYYKRNEEITSIKEALLALGSDTIKRFVSFLSLAGLHDGACQEVVSMSCIRARFCELIATEKKPDKSSELFLLGMFSFIDVILNKSMAHIMKKLPLSDAIIQALTVREGEYADYLNLIVFYEQGEWLEVDALSKKIGVEIEKLPEIFFEACKWVKEPG
jgi:EAL and modified HD-GYP domain-containing signal transduction protein